MLGRIAASALADDLHADVLFDEAVHLVAGAHNQWAHADDLGLADLVDKPWVLAPANTTVHDLVVARFKREALPAPRSIVTTYSMNLRMQLLSGGDYVTAFPDTLVRYSASRWNLKILPVDLAGTLPVAIVTLRNRTAGAAVEMFIERARRAANAKH